MNGAGGPIPRHRSVQRLVPALAALALLAPPARGAPLFLWEAVGPHATVTMIGSIHVGRADFFPLPAPYEEAARSAPVLAVELDPTRKENLETFVRVIAACGTLPDSLTLRDRLTPELWTRLEAAAVGQGLAPASLLHLKPGLAAMTIVTQAYRRQGLDPELGIDRHFLEAAHAQGKAVRELETVEAQLELFLDVDDSLDDILIGQLLDDLGNLTALTDSLVAAWRAGDTASLDAFLQEQTGTDPRMVAYFRRLLDDRNMAMADSVDTWLRGDVDVCVVVGAGHFTGEGGVISLLGDRGWTVTRRQE